MSAITRNLYREDEVLAAIRMSIIQRRNDETVFWVQEALDSKMLATVNQSLFLAWMYGFGPSYPEWLIRFRRSLQHMPDTQHTEVLELALLLCKHGKTKGDTTVPALLGLGLKPINESVGNPPIYETGLIRTESQKAFVRALLQGKTVLALQCSRHMWLTEADTLWAILKKLRSANTEVIHLLENARLWMGGLWLQEYTWLCIACGIALTASKQTLSTKEDTVKPELLEIRKRWIFEPQRFRRTFAPPVTALYWFTRRGGLRTNETTEADLMENLELCLENSTFWAPLMPTTDEERELFYDTYFPTDIPDEWSQDERLLSHGIGVIPACESPNHGIIFSACLDRWFGHTPSRYIWAGAAAGLAELKKWWTVRPPPTFEKGIDEIYSSPSMHREWMNQYVQWDSSPAITHLCE
jgi:hypothetical protein